MVTGGASGDPGTGTTTSTFNVGARNNAGSIAFSGDICELVVYTPAISIVNLRAVMQYLQNRWNL